MHRITTTSDTGEQRIIEYASRTAALRHFSQIALSRHITSACVEKRDNPTALPHIWREVASMELRP